MADAHEHQPVAPPAGVGVPQPSAAVAFRAAGAAGAVAGLLIGALFGVTAALDNSDDVSLGVVAIVPVIALIGGVIGLIVTLLPGAAVAIMLQRIDAAPSGPVVGAIFGGIIGVGLYAWLGNSAVASAGEKTVSLIGFGLGGLIGGLVGGLILKRSVPRY